MQDNFEEDTPELLSEELISSENTHKKLKNRLLIENSPQFDIVGTPMKPEVIPVRTPTIASEYQTQKSGILKTEQRNAF